MIPAAMAERLAPFRHAFAERPLPHVEVPDAITPALAARLRTGSALAPWQRFDLAPRGRYERREERDEVLLASLAAIASLLAGAPHTPSRATWVRMRHGDYALLRDDAPPHAALELVLDVSERATGEGQVLYTHRGQPFFAMTQVPLTLAVVARGATIQRYVRYLTHRAKDAEIVRLVLELQPAG